VHELFVVLLHQSLVYVIFDDPSLSSYNPSATLVQGERHYRVEARCLFLNTEVLHTENPVSNAEIG